jgi:zinc/manganese transport system ATP-binding protein
VLTTDRLSELYDAPVDVLRVRDRIVVVGAPDLGHSDTGGGHHHVDDHRFYEHRAHDVAGF